MYKLQNISYHRVRYSKNTINFSRSLQYILSLEYKYLTTIPVFSTFLHNRYVHSVGH